ncbi:hypothetical protein MTR67_042801, partial [Solanum verrucosum]
MYHLFGMPYALNVWIYECASSINPEIIVKVANGIPKICNWSVVAVKPKYEKFMSSIFFEVYSKFEYLVNLIKANHSEMMNSRNREDDKQPKDLGGKSTPCIVEVSGKEVNDGHQTSTCNFDQQPTSSIQ